MIKHSMALTNFKRELVNLCSKYNAKLIHDEDGISIEFILDDYDQWGRTVQDKIHVILPDEIMSEDD